MSLKRTATLYTGAKIPLLGLGTWRSEPNKVGNAVKVALAAGYRHLDCAWIYGNEKEVGDAIKESGVPREEIFITSKLWNSFHHPDRVEQCVNETLKNLQVGYLDLYLIHWPTAQPEGQHNFPRNADGTLLIEHGYTLNDTWRALEKLVENGKVKHIGISNFGVKSIKQILSEAKIRPAALQVELHPYLPQPELLEFCKNENIHVTAYSPLGSEAVPKVREQTEVVEIAQRLGKTPAQVLLAWGQQRGTSVIPKSTNEDRVKQNFQDIELSEEDINKISNLGIHHRFAVPSKEIFENY
ncbi:aldehyde reductase-like protein [Neoconidiobolus thromboides FSU 785]|nr:aldehyde reductase-like protein [Neoconidiobolus thromboides FSU 785]